jgi:outer membrane protein assembly factor BamB
VDRTRFVFVDRTRPADRADLPLLVPEMDFVVTKERAGPTWASVIEPVFKPRGPGCGAALLIQRPLESARPRYEALDLSRATLTASDNAAALGALVDGRPDTRWAPGEPTPSAWVDITLPRGLHAGSLVVAYAERSDRLSLRVLGAESGRDFMPVRRMVEATPGFQRSLEPQRPGGPCSFERRYVLRDRRPLRALRLEWKASRPEPLSLCELGLSTLVGPDSPGWEDALSQSSRVPPALTVGLTLLAGSLVAGDWPQWRGPARDGIVPGLSPRAAWPAALSPAWKVKVGSGHSSPVVAGDRVFVFSREGEDEVVQALELPTGRRLWRQSYPAPYTMNPAATAHGKGPKSTPVVEGGRVCTLGISGILSCFEAATGRVLWRKEFAPEFRETSPLYGAAMSPVVDQGRLIAHVGGGGQGALTAFDPATGKVLWAWKGDGPGYSSPVVADLAGVRHVVTFSESHLLGVSVERGELLWKLPFTTSYVQNAVTPVIGGGLVIYTGLDHPVRAARLVRKGGSLALEPAWENAEVASYLSSPVLVGGRVCGLSHRRKGQFFCLDAATGKTLWLSEGRQGDNAALLAGGGLLYALTSEAELLIVDPAAASFRELRRYSVAGSPTWAHPVLLGEGVLVKDVETVALLRF